MAGTISPGGQWQWSGALDTGWITIVGASSFNYNDSLTMEAFATVAGQWNNYELEMKR